MLLLAILFLVIVDFLLLRVVRQVGDIYLQSILVALVNGIIVFLFMRLKRKCKIRQDSGQTN